jgi:3-isopropylmalate/(R)-2-methylmalate dehydratase small subunit
MDTFTTHTGRGLPLRRSNVDTDQIIPAEYLKRLTKTGFADGLFAAWRQDPSFVLNDERYVDASILLAGPDFGTGSSREHAVWALQDHGFRVVISFRFGDIFRQNALKSGLLPVQLAEAEVAALMDAVDADPSTDIVVDLVSRTVGTADVTAPFGIDDYVRWRLMEGLDDIAVTMTHDDEISEFEANRPAWMPAASG